MASTRPPRHSHRPSKVRTSRGNQSDKLKRRSLELIRKIAEKDKYAIFLEPVNKDEVPGYAKVIARPMDISTVRANTNEGVYQTPSELRADLDLIWANCIKFNANDTIYYKEAVRLRSLAGKLFEEYLRILERDGLPFRPRATGTSGAASSTTQLRAAATVADVKNVSMQPVSERLRNIARARLKAMREAQPNEEPTELERAANHASDALFPPADKHQIFDGPFQRLRRFPNTHGSVTFPYVHGTRLERLRRPFPAAWRSLGSWQPCSNEEPSLTSDEREREMQYAQQYDRFVTQSAPVARRLLATVLDPLAVLEHDAQTELEANEQETQLNASAVDNTLSDSPKKRPRHGFDEPERMDESTDEVRGMPKTGTGTGSGGMPSPEAISDLRDALKAHNIDDSFLTAILSSSNPSTKTQTAAMLTSEEPAETDTPSKQPIANEIGTATMKKIESGGDVGLTATAPVTTGVPTESKKVEVANEQHEKLNRTDGVGNVEQDVDSAGADSDERMETLLQSNHETMQNVLRLRGLKELATGDARNDLEEEEVRHMEALRQGVTEAAGKLPPRMLIAKPQATALLLDASKEFMRKRKREEEESEKAEVAKKAKLSTATGKNEAGSEKSGSGDGTEGTGNKSVGKSNVSTGQNGIAAMSGSTSLKGPTAAAASKSTGSVSGKLDGTTTSKNVGSGTRTGGVTVGKVMEIV